MPSVELTDRFCQSAKAINKAQTDYFDQTVKGLYLRASPGGTKAFYLFYTKPGTQRDRARMRLGGYPELSLAKAREKAREARAKISEGKIVETSQTVSDLVENYITRYASTKRSGEAIARRLRKNVSAIIGNIKLANLHRRDITKCIDLIKDRGADVEANRVFENFRAMGRWARGRGDLDQNLFEGMQKPSDIIHRDRVLAADEIRSLWKALPETAMGEGVRQIIRLCLITGQRVGEVSGMMRDELDLESAIWTIPAARSKNNREHKVPLSKMALAIIKSQLSQSPFIFPSPQSARVALRSDTATKAIGSERHTFKIAHWTTHDLRRTAATHMEELGVSPFVIGHVLNHVTTTKAGVTSRVYARYTYDKEKREALDLWAARLAGIIEGRVDNIVRLRS